MFFKKKIPDKKNTSYRLSYSGYLQRRCMGDSLFGSKPGCSPCNAHPSKGKECLGFSGTVLPFINIIFSGKIFFHEIVQSSEFRVFATSKCICIKLELELITLNSKL